MLALLTAASAAGAASISKSDLLCRHLETLERLDRLPDDAYLPFVSEQLKTKECVTTEGDPSWARGTAVRIVKRDASGKDICVVHERSPEPEQQCWWMSSAGVAE